MNKYVVKVSSIFSNLIDVEAEDEDMARVVAKDFLESKSNDDETMRHYYESTFPPEQWSVITQEKFDELKEQIKSEIDGGKAAADIA
jgi:hypothetical protein